MRAYVRMRVRDYGTETSQSNQNWSVHVSDSISHRLVSPRISWLNQHAARMLNRTRMRLRNAWNIMTARRRRFYANGKIPEIIKRRRRRANNAEWKRKGQSWQAGSAPVRKLFLRARARARERERERERERDSRNRMQWRRGQPRHPGRAKPLSTPKSRSLKLREKEAGANHARNQSRKWIGGKEDRNVY